MLAREQAPTCGQSMHRSNGACEVVRPPNTAFRDGV